MSIAAMSMMRNMGMSLQYYGAGNAYQNMDSKLALANNVSFGSREADYRDIANKDMKYDVGLAQNSMDYQAGNAMWKQYKALQNDWAEGFRIFC